MLAKEYGANHILESSVEAPKPAPAPEPVAVAPAPAPAPAPEPVVEKPAPVAEAPKAPEAPAPVVEAPAEDKQVGLKILGKIELDKKGNPVAPKAEKAPEPTPAPAPKPEPVAEKPAPAPKPVEPAPAAEEVLEDIELIEARGETLKGLTVLGTVSYTHLRAH